MSERITIGDIEAFLDVLALIGEQSDEFDVAHTTALHVALAGTKAKLEETMSLLQTRLRVLADGASTLASTEGTVKVKPNVKHRPDHDKIRSLIVRRSLFDDDGERLALPEDVAERAVKFTYALFVAPKAEPKKDGLAMLGVSKEDVTTEERIGTKVEVIG